LLISFNTVINIESGGNLNSTIETGKILGIEVVDHIIVTKSSFFSFKEKGLIKES
jgi:hypothetical protein